MKLWVIIQQWALISMLQAVVFLTGCTAPKPASTPDHNDLNSPGALSEQSSRTAMEALEYKEDLADSAAMYERLLTQQFGDAIEGNIVVSPVNGPSAWALLQQNNMTAPFEKAFNAYLKRLLSRDDAQAFAYEIPPSMGAPTGAIFIPYPLAESFEVSPDRPGSPGVFLLFGIEQHDPSPTGEDSPDSQASPKTSSFGETNPWLILTPLIWQEVQSEEKQVVVLILENGCPASSSLETAIKELYDEHSFHRPTFIDSGAEILGGKLHRLLGVIQFPTMVHLRGNEIIDLQVGVNITPIKSVAAHFLARNGVIDGAPHFVADFRKPPIKQQIWLRRLSVLKHWPAANFDGADLRGISLIRGTLSGSTLRYADLQGADLRHAIMTHVDFNGANFQGARIDGVYWRNTICPDGTNSNTHKNTCVGHFGDITLK